MSVDESNIVKKITLGTVDTDENTFNDETKNIGAEAENIIVSYNNHNEIITDLAHNTVDHNEPLAITLRDMKSTFQAGVDTIVEGETSRGLTPAGSTPQALSDAVGLGLANLCDYAYDKLPPEEVAPPSVTDATISDVKTAIDAIQDVTWTEKIHLYQRSNGSSNFTEISLANVISVKFDGVLLDGGGVLLSISTEAETGVQGNIPYNGGIRNWNNPANGSEFKDFTSEEKFMCILLSNLGMCSFTITRQAKIIR